MNKEIIYINEDINKKNKIEGTPALGSSIMGDIRDFEYNLVSMKQQDGSYFITYSDKSGDIETTTLREFSSNANLIDGFPPSVAYLLGYLACESSSNEQISITNPQDTI